MKANLPTILEEWLVDELPRLYHEQPDLLRPLLSSLVTENDALRWALVVGAYQHRRINLGKAAELLGMHELELRDRFIGLGLPLRLGAADTSEAQAEVAAVRAWRNQNVQE